MDKSNTLLIDSHSILHSITSARSILLEFLNEHQYPEEYSVHLQKQLKEILNDIKFRLIENNSDIIKI